MVRRLGDKIDIWQPLFQYKGDFEVYRSIINGVDNGFKTFGGSNDKLLEDIYNNTDTMSDKISELTDFVKNDSVDSSNTQFNTTSGVDSSSADSSVNNIFTNLYNTISNWNESTLRLPFPNSNKYIEINSSTLRGDLAGAGGSVLILIIQSFWLFIVGRFIVKDVLNYYEKLKSGDIVKSSETNIKADML